MARTTAAAATACALVLLSLRSTADAPDPGFEAELTAVRETAARDPRAAHDRLGALRPRVSAPALLARRLAVDELDCRLLQDYDTPLARRTADAGAAALAVEKSPGRDAVLAGARLAACGAGAALDLGLTEVAVSELQRIILQTAQDPTLAGAAAMARLERGLHLSRGGDLVAAQADLGAACSALESIGASTSGAKADIDLCHWELAEHFNRSGDSEEAMQLVEPLLIEARQRKAGSDISIYSLGLAQFKVTAHQPAEALPYFEESLIAARSVKDPVGESYAECFMGSALIDMGRVGESLGHTERSMQILPPGVDPVQSVTAAIGYANSLNLLHRPQPALAALDTVGATMDGLKRDRLRMNWLRQRAAALAQLGRWAEAYASLDAGQSIAGRLNEQRLSEQSARLRAEYGRTPRPAVPHASPPASRQAARPATPQIATTALAAMLLAAAAWFAARRARA